MMEEEIDLRAYFEVLLRHWKWIALLAALAAIVTYVYLSFQPSQYRTSAVVLVTEPRYQMEFDSRFRTDPDRAPAYKAFPTLAGSDGILQDVVDAYTPPNGAPTQPLTIRRLRGMTEATSEGDPSLVVLKVTSNHPKESATIANLWADVFVQRGNEIYSGGGKDVKFFEEQLAQAEEMLDKAEKDVIEFQAHNERNIIENELNSALKAQGDYLSKQRAIALVIQNIQGLRAQLADQPGDQPTSLADGLTALFLQIKAFDADTSTLVQLQVDGQESISDKSLEEQMALLDDLAATLHAKSDELSAQLAELEPQILDLQQKLEVLKVEDDRLSRARNLARETQMTLARKLDEARIAAQEENGVLQVGSHAAVPTRPVDTRKALTAVIAGMLGLMIGVAGAFAIEFWRKNRPQVQDKEA